MKLREIKKIWTVNEQKISPIHTAGFVLAPGNWVDYDPFFDEKKYDRLIRIIVRVNSKF